MRWIIAPFAWAYDFLAEDVVLLVGTGVAIALGVLAVHVARNIAGFILFLAVAAAVVISLWRVRSAQTR